MHRSSTYHPALHALAILTALATFPLIFMGGLVTSHKAGMSVPDWPNSYGYNMFTFPPSLWLGTEAGGIFYEHSHRLLGTLAGFFSVALVLFAYAPARDEKTRRRLAQATVACLALAALSCAMLLVPAARSHAQHVIVGFLGIASVTGTAFLARRREERRWVRQLAVGSLLAVIVQGVLGGLRVVLVNLDLAFVHGCTAQAFFCLTGLLVAVTSRWWSCQLPIASCRGPRTVALAIAAVVLIYLQLVAGAVMRHYDAGLAIPDLPLAYGKLLPPADAAGLKAINAKRIWSGDPDLHAVTLTQVWVHFAHRVGAVLVTAAVTWLVVHILRRRSEGLLRRPAYLLIALLLTQLTLGVLVILWKKPADLTSFHVAFGALTLYTTFLILVRAARLGPALRTLPGTAGPTAAAAAAAGNWQLATGN